MGEACTATCCLHSCSFSAATLAPQHLVTQAVHCHWWPGLHAQAPSNQAGAASLLLRFFSSCWHGRPCYNAVGHPNHTKKKRRRKEKAQVSVGHAV